MSTRMNELFSQSVESVTTVTAAQHASSNDAVSKVGAKGGKHAHFHWAKELTNAEFFLVLLLLHCCPCLSVGLSFYSSVCKVSKVS